MPPVDGRDATTTRSDSIHEGLVADRSTSFHVPHDRRFLGQGWAKSFDIFGRRQSSQHSQDSSRSGTSRKDSNGSGAGGGEGEGSNGDPHHDSSNSSNRSGSNGNPNQPPPSDNAPPTTSAISSLTSSTPTTTIAAVPTTTALITTSTLQITPILSTSETSSSAITSTAVAPSTSGALVTALADNGASSIASPTVPGVTSSAENAAAVSIPASSTIDCDGTAILPSGTAIAQAETTVGAGGFTGQTSPKPGLDKAQQGAIATGLLAGFVFFFAIGVFFVIRSNKNSRLRQWRTCFGLRRRPSRPRGPQRNISSPMPLATDQTPWENISQLPWDKQYLERASTFDTEIQRPEPVYELPAGPDEPDAPLPRFRGLLANPLASNPLTPPITPRFQAWLKPGVSTIDEGGSRSSRRFFSWGSGNRTSKRLSEPGSSLPVNGDVPDDKTIATRSSEPIPPSQRPRLSNTRSTIRDAFAGRLGRNEQSYFSWSTSAPLMTPDARKPTFAAAARDRESSLTYVSTDSEPPRFRTINSWVNHQSGKQYTRQSGSTQTTETDYTNPMSPALPAVPPIPKAHLSAASSVPRLPVAPVNPFDDSMASETPLQPSTPVMPAMPAPLRIIKQGLPRGPKHARDSTSTTSTLPAFRAHPGERIDRDSRYQRARSPWERRQDTF